MSPAILGWPLTIVGVLMFGLWTLAYIFIIRKAYKDKTYGIPIVDGCLNVSWEFVFSFNLALPISELASTVTRATLGIAMASVMLAFLMMITRQKAIPQVIGFLAMENGLLFAATSATYGMPMVVELGIALDVLVGMLILGVFFFQIREQFDSLDLKHFEQLREDE